MNLLDPEDFTDDELTHLVEQMEGLALIYGPCAIISVAGEILARELAALEESE